MDGVNNRQLAFSFKAPCLTVAGLAPSADVHCCLVASVFKGLIKQQRHPKYHNSYWFLFSSYYNLAQHRLYATEILVNNKRTHDLRLSIDKNCEEVRLRDDPEPS